MTADVLLISTATVFVFFSASARARVVTIDFCAFSYDGLGFATRRQVFVFGVSRLTADGNVYLRNKENKNEIDERFGPSDALSAIDCMQYRFKSYYELLKENNMIED